MNEFNFYQQKFIERLREFMNDSSILKFSKQVNIPERTINGWLNKNSTPRMEYLIILSQYFKCSIDFLVGLED